jgi:malate permease and related proteins
MSEFLQICSAIAPPLILLLIGGLCRRGGWLRVEADASLSILTVRVLYPCFFFFYLVGHKGILIPFHFSVLVFSGFLSICLGFGVALVVGYFMKLDKRVCSSFSFCSGIFNYGFFAFPVAAAIFGEQLIPKIIIFNLGVEIAVWTVGVYLLASDQFKWKRLINPPVVSIILAVSVREFGGQSIVPDFAWNIISLLGACAIPIGLLLIGGNFADLLRNFKVSPGYKVEISAILVRLFLVPTFMVLYAWKGIIPIETRWLQEILLIQAAMPAGIFAIVIVKTYDADTKTAMRAIMATMIGCLVSIPIWLYLGVKLVAK